MYNKQIRVFIAVFVYMGLSSGLKAQSPVAPHSIAAASEMAWPEVERVIKLAEMHYFMKSDSAYYYAELAFIPVEDQHRMDGMHSGYVSFCNLVASWYVTVEDHINAYRWINAAKARRFGEDVEVRAGFGYFEPVTLDEARAYCGPGTLILEYSFSDSRLTGLAISQSKTLGWVVQNQVIDDQKNRYIDNLITVFRDSVQDKRPVGEIMQAGGKLAELLIAPAGDLLKKSYRLIIVVDGLLALLPFEALIWNENYLIQDYQIKYTPSVRALSRKAEAGMEFDQDMLQIANPDYENVRVNPAVSFTSLPSSMLEAQAISRLFDKVITLSGKDARESILKSIDLTRYRYLHFATHGYYNEKNPGLSGLVLAQEAETFPLADREDGFLRSREIPFLVLKTDLVVLSGCETGLGKRERGKGILGLQHAFLQAGASTVVVSLWPVYDRSTSLLMTKFYQGLIQYDAESRRWFPVLKEWMGWDTDTFGYKAAAMRNAKLALLENEDYYHPVYWAPFIVTGE
ncbi:MAG: CHAT domain-containing protein [Balneolales bacterium]